jgi:HlyD family secretion protein
MLSLATVAVAAAVLARDATVKPPPPRACETAVATYGPVAGTLRLPGRLSVESTVRIGSGQPGLVTAVRAAVGARVSKGEALAWLDDAEQRSALASADTQLTTAELLALRAQRELLAEIERQRAEGLVPDLVDPDELLPGKAGDAQLEYLNGAAQIGRRKQALVLARRMLERRIVRAPIDGIVLSRGIEPGESIPASPPGPHLFVIGSDPRRLRLEVDVDERHLQSVLPGPASFVVPAYGQYEFSSTVRQMESAAGVNGGPARYIVVLEAPNADGALRPGMSAVVELAMATGRDTLSVPTRALSNKGEGPVAWLPDEGGRPTPIPVKVGVANPDFTEVEGPGIAAGGVVVSDGSPTTCMVSPPAPPPGRRAP